MTGPRFKDSRHLPHYVYRCYDDSSDLLYVGCTVEPVRRVIAHKAHAWWGDRIASVRYTVFPNSDKAHEVERQAIYLERPACNVKSRWRQGDRRADWTLADYQTYRTAVVSTSVVCGPATTRLLRSIDAEVAERFGVTVLGRSA